METLYRKYRPIDFDTVVGQGTVVKAIRNQIIKGSIAHAYLFSGTRGTGKTTVAKIFARAINCPNEINGNPCNECTSCKSALEGANLNIVEIDAASNRSIEGVRKLIEQVQYPPINGEKYKVFIIDEAHALTTDAANAFLKTLEEPPEYVVFILATTDPNKLPETVLSRCQKYNFKRINIELIVEHLKNICEKEKIDIDEDAIVFIAEKSDGSIRESLSQLDRVRAYSTNEKLSKEEVLDILGIVDDDDYSVLTRAVNEGNVQKAFSILSESLEKGKDINRFVSEYLWYLRNLLLIKDLNEPVETLNITKASFEKYKKESNLISKDVIIYFIEELSKTYNVMRYDENRRVVLETSIIRLASPETNFLESAVMARLKNVEDKQKEGRYVTIEKVEKEDDTKKDVKEEKKVEKKREMSLTPVTMDEIKKVTENWVTISSSLPIEQKVIMRRSKPIPGNEKEPGFIEVQMKEEDYYFIETIQKFKEIEDALSKAAEEVINKKIIFKLISQIESKYSEDVKWSLDAAADKIGMEIGEQDDK